MKTLTSLALVSAITAISFSIQVKAGPGSELILASEVKWEQLNPARGDKSPKAGTLWGDRDGAVPTGFLVKFEDGFSSPPHIHNTTYRAVVISGLIHNDDPGAAHMWMPAGSFWTQPEGEAHITAASGASNVALVEIDAGPYLVLPVEKAYDSGERPVNIDASNIVWVDPQAPATSSSGAKVAYLWGRPQQDQLNGRFVKLPPGFTGNIRSQGSSLQAVVIKGQPGYQAGTKGPMTLLAPGSYFSSKGASLHTVSCETKQACIFYVRASGKVDVVSAQPAS